ncbi:MAG: hypothetical protein QOD77_1903 [Thermoplasmata archaeon]|jgi:hypothetical protein|nr:hypothetical protein [Thermoplasmata archaeon]
MRIPTQTLPFAAALALALLSLPNAMAQDAGVEFAITDIAVPETPLAANRDVGRVAVSWAITCKGPASDLHGLLVPSSFIEFETPETPLGIDLVGALTVAAPLPDCVSKMETTGTGQFSVTASEQALGETPLELRFQATLQQPAPDTGQNAPPASRSAIVRVAYQGLLTASVATTILKGAAGETLTYVVEVTNLGNALTLLEFAPADAPRNGQLELPPPTLLARGATVLLPIKYHAEQAGEESFGVEITPRSTLGDEAGFTIQVNLLARATAPHGEAAPPARASPPVPAFAAALAVLAVAAAARRRY